MQPRILNARLIVFPVKDLAQATQVKTCIPSAQFQKSPAGVLGAVPLTLEAARVLRNLGIEAPSPIEAAYDWPIIPGRKPRPHQVATSAYFTLNPRAHCHNAPRTGKTLGTLWGIDYLQRIGTVNKALIVAPLSTLERAWGDEIFLNFPGKRFAVLHGSADKRRKLLASEQDLYVINHDGVEILHKELMSRGDIDLVVIDECFPAGTKVLTPSGERCIETVQLGDSVITSWGARPVTHVFKKTAADMVQLNFEDGTYVRCTPEHPFATDIGWVQAKNTQGRTCLRSEDLPTLHDSLHPAQHGAEILLNSLQGSCCTECGADVPYLRNRVSSNNLNGKVQPCEVLQSEVLGASTSYRCSRRDSEVLCMWRGVLRPCSDGQIQTSENLFTVMQSEACVGNSAPQDVGGLCESSQEETRETGPQQGSTHEAGGEGKAECCSAEPAGSVFGCSRGERYRDVESRGPSTFAATSKFRVQPPRPHEDASGQRVSYLLQSGLWGRIPADSHRGGWEQSWITGETGGRPEKNGPPLGVRVVSVQNLELGGVQDVFNLEVAGPHDYIAGGKVVHNCAVYRNAKTKRWKALNAIVNNRGVYTWCWGLTGTPTSQDPTDAYGQAKLVRPESVKGMSFTAFKDLTMQQFGPFRWVPRKGCDQTVARILSPSIRFERSTVTNMEPCLIERHAELSPEQKHHITKLLREAVTEIDGTTVSAVNAAVLVSKICQAACGVVYGTDGEFLRLDFGPRLKVLEEAIEENGPGKVIVFLPFTGALNAVASELKKKWSVAVVDGSVSANKRNEIYSDFQKKKDPHVLVAHPQCMAHGLELTAADLIAWYSPHPSNEIYTQACCRIDGGGQKSKIDILHISATAAERKIYATVRERGRLQDCVLGLLKEGIR